MSAPAPYAFALGVPGQGFHAARFGGVALYDVIGTLILALITAWGLNIPVWVSIAAWFLVAEFAHWLVGTPTAVLLALRGVMR